MIYSSALALRPHELIAEFRRRTSMPTQAQIDALLRRGMSLWSMAGLPGTGEHAISFARIELDPPRFEFAGPVDAGMPSAGVPGMVVVALNDFGEPADLVAWPLKGDGVGAWRGAVSMIGMPDAYGLRFDVALTVHPNPWAWLKGERRGVVMVNPQRAAEELRDAGPFVVDSLALGERLEALLTRPPPSIYVVSRDQQEAA